MDELTRFCGKMKRSGYGKSVKREVILSGIRGFERMKKNHEEGKRKMYRKEEEGKEVRWGRKISGNKSWLKGKQEEEGGKVEEEVVKKKGGGSDVNGIWWRESEEREGDECKTGRDKQTKEEPEVVVFIPHTLNGILKTRLQERDAKMREAMGMRRIKFVERGRTFREFCPNQTPGGRGSVGKGLPGVYD